MTRAPSDSDPFFQLLTEALRAGPGSAQWGEAVAKLRDGGVDGADEYGLIIRAREDLEKGRDFRRVTAGPGFTRKVLQAVEQEGGRKRNGLPTATLIAILAGVVILGVIVAVIVMSRGGGADDAARAAVARLESTSMPVSVASGSLPGRLSGFELSRGAPVTASPSSQPADRSLTRLVATAPVDADLPAVFEAEIVLPPADQSPLFLFVSDNRDTPDNGIIWSYGGGQATVVAAAERAETVSLGSPGGKLKVSIRFDREVAIVEAGGRRLYAGPHGLDDKPRYVGMHILQRSGDAGDGVRVTSISLAQAAAASPAGGQ